MEVKSLSFMKEHAMKSVLRALSKSTFPASHVTKSARHVKKNLELPALAVIITPVPFILILTVRTALAVVTMITMAI
jgi:hypothetical protein